MVLGLVLVVVLLAGAACSDAHTASQLSLADNGADPDVITILAANSLDPWLQAVTHAYTVENSDISFAYESQVTIRPPTARSPNTIPVVPITRIRSGATPDVWIDVLPLVQSYSIDPRAQGRAKDFAGNPLELIVRAGNPEQVSGLDAFAAGGPTSGLCVVKVLCGLQAPGVLTKAGVVPAPEKTYPDGPTLAAAVAQGQVAAGLVFGTEAVSQGANLETLLVTRKTEYGVLGMMADPAAARFIAWLTTSPDAAAALTAAGMVPTPRNP